MRFRVALFGILLLSRIPPTSTIAHAYEVQTHEEISALAANRSSVEKAIGGVFELPVGLDTNVAGQSLVRWLRQGATREDSQLRFLNHFHNPLSTDWSQAGLLLNVGQSSIVWAQNENQGAPNWSWLSVRQLQFDALTKSAKVDREVTLGRMLEGLGRQIHLAQDAASPGHTRNDPHVFYNYEDLVDAVRKDERNIFNGIFSTVG